MPKPQLSGRTLHIRLSAIEDRIVEHMGANGYMVSEKIRELLREFARREFPDQFKPLPAYVQLSLLRHNSQATTKQEIERRALLTPEQYAVEVLKGKVVGDKAYFLTANSTIALPLRNIKNYTPESDQLFLTHRAILDGEFYYVNGVKMSDEERQNLLDMLEASV